MSEEQQESLVVQIAEDRAFAAEIRREYRDAASDYALFFDETLEVRDEP